MQGIVGVVLSRTLSVWRVLVELCCSSGESLQSCRSGDHEVDCIAGVLKGVLVL